MKIPNFIAIQGSYTQLELALFRGKSKLETIKENNKKASSLLIPYIKQILEKNSLKISDINFICADQGPGAFTSLRVTISIINGISFSNKIPLIGIDGLDAMSQETLSDVMLKNQEIPEILISLLNAYNNEVYFSVNKIIDKQNLKLIKEFNPTKGYKKIDLFLTEIKEKFDNKKIMFTGNGSHLHKDLIEKAFKDQAEISSLQICSVDQIAKMALEKWNKKEDLNSKLYPLYLKSQKFAIRKGS